MTEQAERVVEDDRPKPFGIKAELRAMASIARQFSRLSPGGRAWVLSRLQSDDERWRN